MTSVQRFLSGHNNAVRTAAALSASSVRPASAIERIAATRAGGGRVRLMGEYSGHEAADIDVEIVAAGGVPRASVPTLTGVGNGKLAVLDVDGVAPLQALTFTLRDMGVQTQHAKLEVREVAIRARSPGAAGNDIRITVTPALTRTASDYALLAPWAGGTRAQVGEQWDFGGLPVSAAGELNVASPRVQFGFDPTVYRCYREFKDGGWQHGLSPALERDLAAGTRVWAVTGGYTVTVTDGTDTETYAGMITFYDLLSALTASALVEVTGVVAADRRIGGQAAIDVPLRTAAWLYSLSGKVRLGSVDVPPAAPTQAVTIRCVNADAVGRERWSVAGSVSGDMPPAVTGDLYTHAAAVFLVPAIAPTTADGGEWSFKYDPSDRAAEVGVPSVCLRPARFGSNARARTVTFRYQLRAAADCRCSDMPAIAIDLACLGLEGDENMPGGITDPIYLDRVRSIYAWREGFVQANTSAGDAANPHQTFYAEMRDINLADGALQIMLGALPQVYEEPSALAEWDLMWVDVQNDLAVLAAINQPSKPPGNLPTDLSEWVVEMTFLERYRARMINILILVGIFPNSDASSDAGECWRDYPDETHWWADVDGYYLPAFSNKPYISARRNTETGTPYSTMEFGFGLVAACPERLVVGDTLTVRIMSIDGDRPYQVGDEAVIETIAAGPAWLAGGIDGTDELTWSVHGSVSGALPDYVVPLEGATPVYSAAGIDARISLGGIPFALGDVFSVAIEAGQFRWRRDAGAYGATTDIPATGSAVLADGIAAVFDAGAAPSFVPGDVFAFRVHQPHAVSHVRSAGTPAWSWAGANAQLVIDLGAMQSIASIAVARYDLPASATLTAELSPDGSAWTTPIALDIGRPVAVAMLAPSADARYLRISVSAAAGGSIGWIWAGVPVATRYHASTCEPSRRYAVGRGAGLNPSGLYAGRGVGWTVGWESELFDIDVQRLVDVVDWMCAHDEPIIFVPHHLHPRDAALVTVGSDALNVPDYHNYQPNDVGRRLLSASLVLDPVIA